MYISLIFLLKKLVLAQGAMDHANLVKLLLLYLALITQARGILVAPPCDFPAIYNFGDSNSDTGGISAVFWPISEPYGMNFFERPAGRESDGRLIIDFIAEHLGLPYLSPYLDSIGTNFSHGANFATGGSTIRRPNETIFENGISPFSLDIQTLHYDRFKMRTYDLFHQVEDQFERSRLARPNEFSRALYTFDIGQNDLAVGLTKLTRPQLHKEIPDIVNQLAVSITYLYHLGARAFWIHNTGPIGCLPVTTMLLRNPSPGLLDSFGCIKDHNAIAMEFNRQLKDRVNSLRAEVPRAAVTYVDIYSAKYHLIANAKNYGFMSPMKVCCGIHENNVHVWCGRRTILNGSEIYGAGCSAPASTISWDGLHYSEAANHWIANHLLNGSFSDPPISITRACLKR